MKPSAFSQKSCREPSTRPLTNKGTTKADFAPAAASSESTLACLPVSNINGRACCVTQKWSRLPPQGTCGPSSMCPRRNRSSVFSCGSFADQIQRRVQLHLGSSDRRHAQNGLNAAPALSQDFRGQFTSWLYRELRGIEFGTRRHGHGQMIKGREFWIRGRTATVLLLLLRCRNKGTSWYRTN